MASFALDEQETNYTIEATDRKVVNIFSNDVVAQRQIERLGIESHRSDGYGKFYKVDLTNYTFGIRRKRHVSEEQRAASAERLAALRATMTTIDDDDDFDDDPA